MEALQCRAEQNHEEALGALTEAQRYAPDDSQLMTLRGHVLMDLKKWDSDDDAGFTINGHRIASGRKHRQGIVYDTDGVQTKVVWLELKSSRPVNLKILKQ